MRLYSMFGVVRNFSIAGRSHGAKATEISLGGRFPGYWKKNIYPQITQIYADF